MYENPDSIINLLISDRNFSAPMIYTIRLVEKNIYHNLYKNDEFIAFNDIDNLVAINSNGERFEFSNYMKISWNCSNHIDMYVTGATNSLKKFNLTCCGSVNKDIEFNLNESIEIDINGDTYVMSRNKDSFNWTRKTNVKNNTEFNKLCFNTNNFSYNILSVESDCRIKGVYLSG